MGIKVIVASKNPAKIEAVRNAFLQAFSTDIVVEGVAVSSGVSDQPMSDEETRIGALNRAMNAKALIADADFWVGVEGGVCPVAEGMEAFGWMAILGIRQRSLSRSASFLLPPQIAHQISSGHELGPAMDVLFKEKDSKTKGGAVGLLSNGLVSRAQLYEQPLLLALIPFLQKQLFEDQ
jgi:inosine/xanthosine triphosphatase